MKKLITSEEDEISEHREKMEQLQKVHEQYVNTFNEKVYYQQQLIGNLRSSINNKKSLDQFFHQSDQIIEQSSLQTIEKIKEDQRTLENQRQQQNKINQMEKNKSAMNDKLEQLQETFRRVCELIDMKISDPDYIENQTFQKFIECLDHKSALDMKIISQEERIAKLNEELQAAKSHLQTIKNAERSTARQSTVQKNSVMQSLKTQQFRPESQILSKEQTQEGIKAQEEEEQLTLQDFEQLQLTLNKDYENKQYLAQKLQQIKLSCMVRVLRIIYSQLFRCPFQCFNKSQIQPMIPINPKYQKQNQHLRILTTQKQNQHLCIQIQIQVCEHLDVKHQKVKQNLNEREYRQFLSDQYDFAPMYKQAIKYYQDPILAEMEMD